MVASALVKVPAGRLLLVEDDIGVRRSLQLTLEGNGFAVHAFAAADPALAEPAAMHTSHLVADYILPDRNGIELLQMLRAKGWCGIAVLISAFANPETRAIAKAAGFCAVIDKPFHDECLLAALGIAGVGVMA